MSGNSSHHATADIPNNNNNPNGSHTTSTLANVNELPNMGTITETRAIITSANQRHQLQMQQEQNRNSMMQDANDIIGSGDTIPNHNTKIIQSCNNESRTGILAGVLPMLAKQSSQIQSATTTTTTASATTQSKLSNTSADLHDIDRLFSNSSHSISDNAHLINNDGETKANRNDLVTIVTISGCTTTESSTGEMDILAHL